MPFADLGRSEVIGTRDDVEVMVGAKMCSSSVFSFSRKSYVNVLLSQVYLGRHARASSESMTCADGAKIIRKYEKGNSNQMASCPHGRLLHEVVLDRIAGGSAAGIHPQLIEERGHMRFDGR